LLSGLRKFGVECITANLSFDGVRSELTRFPLRRVDRQHDAAYDSRQISRVPSYPAIFSRLSRHMLKLSEAAKLTQTR
jgi:hypothetical protein